MPSDYSSLVFEGGGVPHDDAGQMAIGGSKKRKTRKYGIRKKAKRTRSTRDKRRSYRRRRRRN